MRNPERPQTVDLSFPAASSSTSLAMAGWAVTYLTIKFRVSEFRVKVLEVCGVALYEISIGEHRAVPLSPKPYSLRVQVANNHILTPNLYYNYYHPNPKYPVIGYMDPLGLLSLQKFKAPPLGQLRPCCASDTLNLKTCALCLLNAFKVRTMGP